MKIIAQLKKKTKEFYPLSPMQEGMLFHTLYAPRSGVYIEQVTRTLRGAINVPALESAWREVISRHSALRTSFVWEDIKNPIQVVHENLVVPLEQHDWRGLSEAAQSERLGRWLEEDRETGFDVSRPPLMRFNLMRLAEDSYEFIWTWHHLLMDGWSSAYVDQEVIEFYSKFKSGKRLKLKEPRPYRDYIAWLRKQDLFMAERYWKRSLNSVTAPPALIRERIDGVPGTQIRGEASVQLSRETTDGLKSLAKQSAVTLNTLIQGAWAILLSRYAGEQFALFGWVVSGRPSEIEGIESMVGLFINTIPSYIETPPSALLQPWLRKLQADQALARQYEFTSLVDVHGWSRIPRNQPLFESILIFENAGSAAPKTIGDAGDADLSIERTRNLEQVNYPLSLLVFPFSQMAVQIMYDRHRFGPETIERMLGHFTTILESMIASPGSRLSSLEFLSESERSQLLVEWNRPVSKEPEVESIIEMFRARVLETPDAIALVYDDEQLTYAELLSRSNRLANHLLNLGLKEEGLVAVCLDRSPQMVITLLAVLSAGGAYIPLDPYYPSSRLSHVLRDANPSFLIYDKRTEHVLDLESCEAMSINCEGAEVARCSDESPGSGATPEGLCYVIYTSGSTGTPRGVQITHSSVVNFLNSMAGEPGMDRDDTIIAVTTISFDIAALEIFLPLVTGARLILADRETVTDGASLAGLIFERDATILQATPASWRSLVSVEGHLPEHLKMLCGGEALPRELAARLVDSGAGLWNMYGPTETTIWSAAIEVEPGDGPVPIGKPIANTTIYLLDKELNPVPVWVPGELYIGGAGLARGYSGHHQLTAERFIPDPFSQNPGVRLYKTGDLALYLPDGKIEYVGRADFQMKVRGFRVEAGEVEAALAQHQGIAQCVVMARDDASGEKVLVAYVVYQENASSETGDLRKFLAQRLPSYMVPSHFVTLDELPLTPNGKVDRKALPGMGESNTREFSYIAPRSLLEHKLVEVWEEIFNVRPIGVRDQFFDLGGHSLLAVRMMAQIHKRLGQRLPLAILFEEGTVEGLARAIRKNAEVLNVSPLVAIQPDGSQPPLFCVHSIGGQVIGYRELSMHLGTDRPFYGLQAPDFAEIGADYISIEEMASQYLEAISSVRSEGPFLLGGYSFGAFVAFEMAQQLVKRGEQVPFLFLLDAWSPGLFQKLPGDDDDAALLALLARVMVRAEGKEIELSPEDLHRLSPEEQLKYALEQVKKARIFDENITDEIGIPYVRSYLNGYKTRQRAMFRYKPQVYHGRITLIRCLEEDQEILKVLETQGADTSDPTFGWGDLSTQRVQVELVPGFHERMLMEPYVADIATKIKERLQEACLEAVVR